MKKVLLIGDFITDIYHHHTAVRLCPEAPVPVLHRTKPSHSTPGGAGLVDAQLRALGVELYTVYTSWSRKERYMADNQLLVRVDEDSEGVVIPQNVLDYLDEVLVPENSIGAIVVSDYGKGGLTREIAQRLLASKIPMFVDAKTNWHWYDGAFAAFPNLKEVKSPNFREEDFQHVIVKQGEFGCSLDGVHFPTTAVPVRDPCGAGDTFIAAFVKFYLRQSTLTGAAQFANHLAGISVQHVGTYVVSWQDVGAYWSHKDAA